jgi:DNA-binding PadR family transcriptional regulator
MWRNTQWRGDHVTLDATRRWTVFNANLKRGSMELLILSTLEDRTRHGYEIGKLLERRSGGRLEFRVSTLYSILYRMERSGWIKGRWVEKPGQRRRCYYTLTAEGTEVLAAQKKEWRAFSSVVNRVIGVSHA